MAIAYFDRQTNTLNVYAHWHAIAPPRRLGRSGSAYWALAAFGVLAEHEWKEYPVNAFTFKLEMRPAIERILRRKKQDLLILSKTECIERVKEAIEGKRKRLEEPRRQATDTKQETAAAAP